MKVRVIRHHNDTDGSIEYADQHDGAELLHCCQCVRLIYPKRVLPVSSHVKAAVLLSIPCQWTYQQSTLPVDTGSARLLVRVVIYGI